MSRPRIILGFSVLSAFLVAVLVFFCAPQTARLRAIIFHSREEALSPGKRTPALNVRPAVTVVDFENKTGDPAAGHWGAMLRGLIGGGVYQVKALRLVSDPGYAFAQLKRKAGDPVDAAQARRIGELTEARWVVWGSYEQQGRKWRVRAHVLNVATGNVSKELSVGSADWFEIRDQLTEKTLREIGVKPTRAERRKLLRRWTDAPATLSWLSKAGDEKSPLEREACLRRAREADPRCAEVHYYLAMNLDSQGRLDEAEEAIGQALSLKADYARAYRDLGWIFTEQTKLEEAEGAFQTAARLDPDDATAFEALARFYTKRGFEDRAVENLNKALQLDPASASAHAELGCAYARQGKRPQALLEFKEAERFTTAEDNYIEGLLASGYGVLGELPMAAEHLEKQVTALKKQGGDPKAIEKAEKAWRAMTAPKPLVYITNAAPKEYTEQSLAEALRQKLTPGELALVINPLASTPAMNRWAHELTQGATNELQKARMLFNGLRRHVSPSYGGTRTAQEVFAAWHTPGVSFRCGEYTCLYVALARAVGLKTYFVYVDEECDGKKSPHSCASVFVADKALLIDPSYRWFGVPHKKFTLLDDMQLAGSYLTQGRPDLEKLRTACRLAPDLALVQFGLVGALAREGLLEEARQALLAALRLEPDGWKALHAQAWIAAREGKFEQVVDLLEKALARSSDVASIHLWLGAINARQGNLHAAQNCYRNALQCPLDEGEQEKIRQTLAQIDKDISARDKAMEQSAFVGALEGEGLWKQARPALPGASRLEPEDRRALDAQATIAGDKGQFEKVRDLLEKDLARSPNVASIHLRLGALYAAQGKFLAARNCYRNALQCPLDEGEQERIREALAQIAKDISAHDKTIESRMWSKLASSSAKYGAGLILVLGFLAATARRTRPSATPPDDAKSRWQNAIRSIRAHLRSRAFLVVFVGLCLAVFLISALGTLMLPGTFANTARIRLHSNTTKAPEPGGRRSTSDILDARLLQAECEVIQSAVILNKVLETVHWAEKYGAKGSLSSVELRSLLRGQLDVRPVPDASAIAIRMFSSEPREAARIASAVAEAYREHCSDRGSGGSFPGRPRAEIIDVAKPSRVAVWPKLALGMVMGLCLGFVAGAGASWVVCWIGAKERTKSPGPRSEEDGGRERGAVVGGMLDRREATHQEPWAAKRRRRRSRRTQLIKMKW